MQKTKSQAFTLVELVVVITILAILGTIAFISFSGYSKDARNSSRVSDLKVVQKGLDLHITTSGALPLPDTPQAITYSGGLAWTQGDFGESVKNTVQRVSSVPIDPLFGTQYAYSVVSNRRQYQLAAALEGGSLFGQTTPISSSYALSNTDFSSYNLGNYIQYDVVVNNGTNCYAITAPSIILSDIPAGGVLENNTPYNYTYNGSAHISSNYNGFIDNTNITPGFQNIEVFAGCSVTNISQLQLYNAELSTAFQQFADETKYEELIFNSLGDNFMLNSAIALQERGIIIDSDLLDDLISPAPLQTFSDDFTNSDGTNLILEHTPDSLGNWITISGGNSDAYGISGNTLIKNDGSDSKIYPRPNPNIVSADYEIVLDVQDFSGGDISLYLRYVNTTNYYRVDLSSAGYVIYKNEGVGEVPVTSNLSSPITPGTRVRFGINQNATQSSLELSIGGVPQGANILEGVTGRGNPVLWLQNSGARIDNYRLNYK